MARKAPCQYCKQRRRKCERTNESDICQRCAQMDKQCVPQNGLQDTESSDDDESSEDYQANEELGSLLQQVTMLEDQLRLLEIQQSALVKRTPVWEIQYKNGQLHLNSEIKTLEELMLYGQSVIKYLSPFGNTFTTKSLVFERMSPSLVSTAMKIVSKYNTIEDLTSKTSSAAVISQRFATELVQLRHPEKVITKLIDIFFHCMNDTIPIIHEPSFREHCKSVKNPMQDSVILAVCTAGCVISCDHSFFSSYEKRHMGEYFYKKSMDILLEVFDDPEKPLEALITINLLQMFMVTTLRLSESKKWATIALLLSNNLKSENPDCFGIDPHLPILVRAKYATIHRNSVLAECLLSIIEFLANDRHQDIVHTNFQFDILPDESQKIKDILEMMNTCFSLSMSPTFNKVITQARRLATGDVAELTFEELVRYEETILKWYNQLPDHLKICPEPFGLTPEIIEKETDVRRLLMACYIHAITLSIQGCLIQPRPEKSLESLYSVVRDRAIYLGLKSADLILLVAKRIDEIKAFCYSPAKVLICSIDSLMTLLQVSDKGMQKIARRKLSEYMRELNKRIPTDHQVSPLTSPFNILIVAPPGSTPSIAELYKNYPLPGEALLYDIVRTTVNRQTSNDPFDTTSYM